MVPYLGCARNHIKLVRFGLEVSRFASPPIPSLPANARIVALIIWLRYLPYVSDFRRRDAPVRAG
jgi:hypothetical protein